jgi:hypothetical protein
MGFRGGGGRGWEGEEGIKMSPQLKLQLEGRTTVTGGYKILTVQLFILAGAVVVTNTIVIATFAINPGTVKTKL